MVYSRIWDGMGKEKETANVISRYPSLCVSLF